MAMTHRKSARPFQPNIERVSRYRIQWTAGSNIINNPLAWKYYGHYNKMSAEELQNEIIFYKDTLMYRDEYDFVTELIHRKKHDLPITPL